MLLCRVSVFLDYKDSWSNGYYLRLLTRRSRVRILAWAGLFLFFFIKMRQKVKKYVGMRGCAYCQSRVTNNQL